MHARPSGSTSARNTFSHLTRRRTPHAKLPRLRTSGHGWIKLWREPNRWWLWIRWTSEYTCVDVHMHGVNAVCTVACNTVHKAMYTCSRPCARSDPLTCASGMHDLNSCHYVCADRACRLSLSTATAVHNCVLLMMVTGHPDGIPPARLHTLKTAQHPEWAQQNMCQDPDCLYRRHGCLGNR